MQPLVSTLKHPACISDDDEIKISTNLIFSFNRVETSISASYMSGVKSLVALSDVNERLNLMSSNSELLALKSIRQIGETQYKHQISSRRKIRFLFVQVT